MQYQLEHHLFPTIPRYKYRKLVPLVKKFAEENGLEYKSTGSWEIIRDNISQVHVMLLSLSLSLIFCLSSSWYQVFSVYCCWTYQRDVLASERYSHLMLVRGAS